MIRSICFYSVHMFFVSFRAWFAIASGDKNSLYCGAVPFQPASRHTSVTGPTPVNGSFFFTYRLLSNPIPAFPPYAVKILHLHGTLPMDDNIQPPHAGDREYTFFKSIRRSSVIPLSTLCHSFVVSLSFLSYSFVTPSSFL